MDTLESLCIKKLSKIIMKNGIRIDKLNIPKDIELKILYNIIDSSNRIELGTCQYDDDGFYYPVKFNGNELINLNYKHISLNNSRKYDFFGNLIVDFRSNSYDYLTSFVYLSFNFTEDDLKHIFLFEDKIRVIFLEGYTEPNLFKISHKFSKFTDLILHLKTGYVRLDDFYSDSLRTICPEYNYSSKIEIDVKFPKNKLKSMSVLFRVELFENINYMNRIKFIVIHQKLRYVE